MADEGVEAIKAFASAIAQLRKAKVIRSSSYTGDLGEWYVATLFGGERAKRGQKGWDVSVGATGERLQVKAQRYDKDQRWQYLGSDPSAFTHLVSILLTDDLRILRVCKVPTEKLVHMLKTESTTKKLRYLWDDLAEWEVPLRDQSGYAALVDLIAK